MEEFEQRRQSNNNAAFSSYEMIGGTIKQISTVGNNETSRKYSPGMNSLQHSKAVSRKVSPTVSLGHQNVTAISSFKGGSPILSGKATKRGHQFAQDLCSVSNSGRRAKFHKFSLSEERWKWNSFDVTNESRLF
jgi:hypothetical protein